MRPSAVLLLSLFFFSYQVQSQQEEIPVQLPQVFPVSPESASLGKYGDIPVDLSTGKINYTVPLYTIKVGDFEWPVYLSYNYSGFIVENDPGYTGLGWDLMAAGRITREIKGVPDEMDTGNFKATTIVPYLSGDFDNLPAADYEFKRNQIYDQLASLNGDGQYDNYRVSAGNVNGTFKINENNQAVFLVHRNYVAEKDFIIDERGIKYYFDEIEMAEYTIFYGSDNAPIQVPSSYLLTKIELPDNQGDIIFEYKPFNASTDIYYKKVWSSTEISGIENRIVKSESQSAVYTRLLKSIKFPNGQIDFTITPHDQQYSDQHGTYTQRSFALEDMTVSNLSSQIMRYDFQYTDKTYSKKLLKEITRSNNGSTESYFKFNYYNESSITSNFDHTAQDNWGYYNGRPANSLIVATKEIDTVKTKYGALQQITYPTGGTTSIQYEQNKVYSAEGSTTLNCSYTHNFTRTFRFNPENQGTSEVFENTLDVGASQIVRIKITAAVKKGTTSNALGNFASISVTANNAGTNCGFSTISNFNVWADAEQCSLFTNQADCHGDLILTKEIIGYAGDGIINISGSVTEAVNKEAYIEYEIFHENVKKIGSNKNVGGIRVSSTTDCADSAACNTTFYGYNTDYGRSTGVLLGGSPQYEYTTYHENESSSLGTITGSRTYRSAKSRYPITSYSDSPVLYEWVKVTKGDGANGYIKNRYSTGSASTNPGFPFLESVNYDWMKGKLLSTQVYENSSGSLKLIKETINEYTSYYPYGYGSDNTRKAYGMDVGRIQWIYGPVGERMDYYPDDYREDYNVYYPKEYRLTRTTVEEFTDQPNPIVNTVNFSYDLPYLQLKEITTKNSRKMDSKRINFYSYDLGIYPLTSRNQISALVRADEYLDQNEDGSFETNEKLTTRLFSFRDWGNNIILPETVQTSKGNNSPEARIRYHTYNLSGKPLEVSKEGGSHIVYLWGYNGQHPIAEIQNATAAEVAGVWNTTIAGLSSYNETNMAAINALRSSLPKAEITTYSYIPLIGVLSVTDPKGLVVTYEYDDFSRLWRIKDDEDNILKENIYHYKDQTSN